MGAGTPSLRHGQRALAALRPRVVRTSPFPFLVPAASGRAFSSASVRRAKAQEDLSNPLLDDYLRKQEAEKKASKTGKAPKRPSLRPGGPSNHPSSLFLPERETLGGRDDLSPEERRAMRRRVADQRKEAREAQDRQLSELSLDPAAHKRRSLERKLILASVTRRGRMTKAQKIMRTERQSTFKSQFLPTSVKKLQKLVNQMAGKTIPEALVQLRFSKKKVARDVVKGLELAQNEAVVARGMGLGTENGKSKRRAGRTNGKTAIKPTLIQLKNGGRKFVRDPTEIYIDQAWVGRGQSWQTADYRARGQSNPLTHRTTNFTVLLKEEATRMRISDELKKKRDNRKLWMPLPDRPVTSQRQFCLW